MSGPVVEGFTLLSLGLIVIGVRVYSRWVQVGPASFQLDDYLMPITGVSSTVQNEVYNVILQVLLA